MSEKTAFEALQDFYKETGLEPYFQNRSILVKVRIGRFYILFPNFSLLKNIYLHDLNHLITPYKPNWKGEFELSAWELAAGGWKTYWIAWYLCLTGTGIGIFIYPRAMWKAYKTGIGQTNTCKVVHTKNDLHSISFDELKTKVLTYQPRRENRFFSFVKFLAWGFLSTVLFWAHPGVVVLLIYLIIWIVR